VAHGTVTLPAAASAGSDGIVLHADHVLVGKIQALCNETLARAARSLA
jgi:hypothetical protein